MIIKDQEIYAPRVTTYRNVEDWREDPAENREGNWAVHCVDHNHRSFYRKFSNAMACADLPRACPICHQFDLRCSYCPADADRWKQDPTSGFTPSIGHIAGQAVCLRHKYGPIPTGFDYRENLSSILEKLDVEVFVDQALPGFPKGMSIFIVRYSVRQRECCLEPLHVSESMTQKAVAHYTEALTFGIKLCSSLNHKLQGLPHSSLEFETWDEHKSRIKSQ